MSQVLVVGLPRSGTTWLARVLASAPRTRALLEPDNPAMFPAAQGCRVRYGAWPLLDTTAHAPEYQLLWDRAFSGSPPGPPTSPVAGRRYVRIGQSAMDAALRPGRKILSSRKHLVVKSVFVGLALEWIAQRYGPRIVVIERDPIPMILSWLRLGFDIGDLGERDDVRTTVVEPRGLPPFEPGWPVILQIAWAIGVLRTAMKPVTQKNPDWLVVSHERLNQEPAAEIPMLARALGLPWSSSADAIVQRERSSYPSQAGGPDPRTQLCQITHGPAAMRLLERFPGLL